MKAKCIDNGPSQYAASCPLIKDQEYDIVDDGKYPNLVLVAETNTYWMKSRFEMEEASEKK